MAIFAAWSAALYAVANLRSAERPARFASARSRAIRARILSNSFLEVLCFWASLFANKLVQVTLASFHKLFPPSQHGGEEMIARFDFLPKLLWGISRDVDLSSQPRLRLAERWRQVSKACSANDHHIHVTHRMFSASCQRTIDKSTLNLVPKRFQCPLQDRSQPCRFFEELLQVSEHW